MGAVMSQMPKQIGTIMIYVFSMTAALSFNDMMTGIFSKYTNEKSLHARIVWTLITILMAAWVASYLISADEYDPGALEVDNVG